MHIEFINDKPFLPKIALCYEDNSVRAYCAVKLYNVRNSEKEMHQFYSQRVDGNQVPGYYILLLPVQSKETGNVIQVEIGSAIYSQMMQFLKDEIANNPEEYEEFKVPESVLLEEKTALQKEKRKERTIKVVDIVAAVVGAAAIVLFIANAKSIFLFLLSCIAFFPSLF